MKRIKIILSAAIVALLSLFAFGSSFKANAASNYIDVTEYAESLSASVYQSGGYVDTYYYIQVSETAISELVDFSEGYYIVSFAEAATSSPSGYFSPDKQFTAYSSQYNGYTFESSIVISMMNIIMPEAPTNGVAYTVAYNNTITSLNKDDEGIPYYVNHDLVACYDYRLSNSGLRESLLVAGEDFKVYYVANEDDPVIEYDKWYEEKAANVGNPLLLKSDQYFEGVSINSHVISDLTYLEIPFEKYLGASDVTKLTNTQIITFAQAQYELDGVIETELVMYVYYPNYIYSGKKLTYAQVEFNLLEQQISNGTLWMNWNVLDYSDYTDIFRAVSYYNNIIKFTWSTTTSDIILRPMDEGVKTTFNAKIKDFAPHEYCVSIDDLVRQEFQFYRGPVKEETPKGLKRAIRDNEHTSCVGYDYKTVSVNAVVARQRFRTDAIKDITSFGFGYYDYGTEYTDFFFVFFSVTDDVSGEKWGTEKEICKVNLRYYDTVITKTWYHSNRLMQGIKDTYEIKIEYCNFLGGIVETESRSSTKEEYETVETKTKNLPSTYVTQTITPSIVTFKYPDWTSDNFWADFKDQSLDMSQVKFRTLWSLDDPEFKDDIEKGTNFNREEFSAYQYGLMLGNKNGYICDEKIVNNTSSNYTETQKIEQKYHQLNLVDFLDIEYMEDGQRYYVKTSSTKIDSSMVDIPFDSAPGDVTDLGKEPDPDAKDKWWYKIYIFFTETLPRFFKETIPNFFKKNKPLFIGILTTIVVVVLIIIIFKIVNFINAASAARKISKAAKSLNKKE